MFRLALLTALTFTTVTLAEPPEGFKALFNGKDTTGWKVHAGRAEAWSVDDGLLVTSGEGGGWLLTEDEFANFELMLEYQLPKGGNSGVALRTPRQGDPAYTGMEIQLLDDPRYKGLRPAQHTGSIYDVVPSKNLKTNPPGEWNSMHIIVKDRHVTIKVNGTTVVDANLDEHKDSYKRHPGLTRKSGHVGVQSHGSRVAFRNIYIKTLD